MSIDSLSIKSIASQYTLPVVVRSALGLRGSSQPIILHSITSRTFAFGRALKKQQSSRSAYQSFRPIDSEMVAIPLKYPGYFECLLPSSHGPEDGIEPERSILPIVERMQTDLRPQAFYIASPLPVYVLESNSNGQQHRLWQQLEANQLILVEQLIQLEYTPTEKDHLTDDDYEYSWLLCFSKRLLNRQEFVLKCILSNEKVCYIPCSSTDEVCLYPVGQRGSTNVHKWQTIENLLKHFSLPINIKLAQFPDLSSTSGAEVYRDFDGCMQLLGSQTEEFAVCASLSSSNASLVAVTTPIKFVVAPVALTSAEAVSQLSRCQMFLQSFDNQIRRILVPSHDATPHRSASRHQSTLSGKRSSSAERMTPTMNDARSGASAEKRRSGFRMERAISTSGDDRTPRQPFRRTLSTDNSSIYDSLVHPVRSKSLLRQSPTPTPTPPLSLSKKRSHHSRSSMPFTYDTGINLARDINLSNADGAILLGNMELFSSVKSDNRSLS